MEFARILHYSFPLVRGEDVRAVQQALIALGTQPPCGVADGVYGFATQKAVTAFQSACVPKIGIDGKVGQDTWTAMFHKAGVESAPSALIRSAGNALPPMQKPGTVPGDPPPLNREQCRRAKAWLTANFGPQIQAAIKNAPPLDVDTVCAIAGKETGNMWLAWADRQMDPSRILEACIGDASGDFPNTSRSAFPQNAAVFRAKFGDAFTDDLIGEANKSRQLRNMSKAAFLYKGYGIVQYDLQHVVEDEPFFREKLWGRFDACMDRFMREMTKKIAAAGGDLFDSVRRYNGAGKNAVIYAQHVMQMREWCAGR